MSTKQVKAEFVLVQSTKRQTTKDDKDFDLVSVVSNSDPESDDENNLPDENELEIPEEKTYPSFNSKLSPKYFEFGSIFPPFPKTHRDGFATIIELPPELLNPEALNKFKSAMQYSKTLGHGKKTTNHSEFFAVDGEYTSMEYSMRQCAGIISLFVIVESNISVRS
jgi:hypothetical protein